MNTYNAVERQTLLKIARASINEGLTKKRPLMVNVTEYSEQLQQERACFVTLQEQEQLRGCIGSLQAHRALVEDVAENAFAAAFRDPRFSELTAAEYKKITIHISVLSSPELMHFSSEADLLRQLRPGIDGLILADGFHRGTFLPSVWEQLPTPKMFLMHLKNKAGLPAEHWSNSIQIERYTAEMIE